MGHVSPTCHGDADDPAGASRDRTERLCDVIRNYDPSGGTGRFKSSRPDQTHVSFPISRTAGSAALSPSSTASGVSSYSICSNPSTSVFAKSAVASA